MSRFRRATGPVDEPYLLDADSLTTGLLLAAASAVRARLEAGHAGDTRRSVRPAAPPADREQVPVHDPEAVADWLVGLYPRPDPRPAARYPAVVIGSSHASAVHLAAAMGVPWLPAGYDVRPPRSRVAGEENGLVAARRVGQELSALHGDAVIRCGFDPLARGHIDPIWLSVRWRELPEAYRRFLDATLAPGGTVILTRDLGRWLVRREGPVTVQIGRRAAGIPPEDYQVGSELLRLASTAAGAVVDPAAYDLGDATGGDGEFGLDQAFVDDLRRWTVTTGRGLRQVVYPRPEPFSAAVADLYRDWLRSEGRTGNRLIVECGRLVAPWQVLRAGLVPYWCEHPLVSAAEALIWWVAGSEPFSEIEALVEPPGMALPTIAGLRRWISVTKFATRRAHVDKRCARAYPLGTVPASYAGHVVRGYPCDLPCPPPLAPQDALTALAGSGETNGVLVA
jgi:hypothetical protein